jgi:hypothetical protein
MPTTVVNVKTSPYQVYIGRGAGGLAPSQWGNPFKLGAHGNRADVIEQYRLYLLTQPKLLAQLPWLQEKSLGCHCQPEACHGDVLAEICNHPRGVWYVVVSLVERSIVSAILDVLTAQYDMVWEAGMKEKYAQNITKLGHPNAAKLQALATEKQCLQNAWNNKVFFQWQAFRSTSADWESHLPQYLQERL